MIWATSLASYFQLSVGHLRSLQNYCLQSLFATRVTRSVPLQCYNEAILKYPPVHFLYTLTYISTVQCTWEKGWSWDSWVGIWASYNIQVEQKCALSPLHLDASRIQISLFILHLNHTFH